ncbi:unnamed protein product, partial [marine sediment metagenome]
HTGLTSEQFAEALLFEEAVAAVPGNAFGESGQGYSRCTYATGMEQLTRGTCSHRAFPEEAGKGRSCSSGGPGGIVLR